MVSAHAPVLNRELASAPHPQRETGQTEPARSAQSSASQREGSSASQREGSSARSTQTSVGEISPLPFSATGELGYRGVRGAEGWDAGSLYEPSLIVNSDILLSNIAFLT